MIHICLPLKRCRSLSKEHNVLFIADEIKTGIARTGKMLAIDHEGIKADILILGKGLLNTLVINSSEDSTLAWDICVRLKENGLLAKPTHGNKIRFAPPLVMTESQLEDCLGIIEQTLKSF